MNRKHLFITLITLFTYFLAKHGLPTIFPTVQNVWLRILMYTLPSLMVAAAGLLLIHRRIHHLPEVWGIRQGFGRGLRFAFLMTLPMLIGYGIANHFQINVRFERIFYGVLIAPIVEELLYRGFLFGQLYRYGGWGFIPSGLLNALIFGALHLHQAQDFSSAVAVFAVTAMGGLWFAWLYIEWDNQLWISIFLHLFMNAWWIVFETDHTAAGNSYANILRGLTIAASIIITIRMRKKQGGLRITRSKLWINKVINN
ncbi:MAG TPA: CPBP family intramembrane metalloprotease [Saprospiraceae bacterium]|nr:CPBP family intramembrane metalloprotease [Saprospiraceae bacterium]HMP24441.1 CPBP family intramembrane metalloprotease [Saprospiraceae bacterium]